MKTQPSERLQSAAEAMAAETGTAPHLSIGVEATDLTDAMLRKLHLYWQSLRCGGLPSYRGLDPLDLKFALGNIMLAEPVAGGTDFHYRVGATVTTKALGIELTGKKLSQCFHPLERAFYLATYREVFEHECALHTFHVPPRQVPIRTCERLMLPLYDEAGRVARILTGVIPGDSRIPQGGS